MLSTVSTTAVGVCEKIDKSYGGMLEKKKIERERERVYEKNFHIYDHDYEMSKNKMINKKY
jgi:hypothetical protein